MLLLLIYRRLHPCSFVFGCLYSSHVVVISLCRVICLLLLQLHLIGVWRSMSGKCVALMSVGALGYCGCLDNIGKGCLDTDSISSWLHDMLIKQRKGGCSCQNTCLATRVYP